MTIERQRTLNKVVLGLDVIESEYEDVFLVDDVIKAVGSDTEVFYPSTGKLEKVGHKALAIGTFPEHTDVTLILGLAETGDPFITQNLHASQDYDFTSIFYALNPDGAYQTLLTPTYGEGDTEGNATSMLAEFTTPEGAPLFVQSVALILAPKILPQEIKDFISALIAKFS